MNMKLKKLLALLLAMMMAFALVACGDTADTGDDAADDQQVQDDARHAANLREQCAALDTLRNRLFQQRVEAV